MLPELHHAHHEEDEVIPPEILAEGYETRDLNVSVIGVWTIATVVVVAVSYILLDGLYTQKIHDLKAERWMTVDPAGFDRRTADRNVLANYSRLDENIRIPIEAAMAKVAEDDAAARR